MKNTLYVCVGAPGSGKSTWSKQLVKDNDNVIRLCPDEFRALVGTGEDDMSVSHIAFNITYEETDKILSNGKSVVIDATNMYKKARKKFLKIADKYNCNKVAVVFEMTKENLIERNIQRSMNGGRRVPDDVIDRMLTSYQTPTNDEFNSIVFISKL